MAATPSQSHGGAGDSSSHGRTQRLGFVANAIKRKDAYIQLLLMTGIFMLSLRSLGQKYRINDLSQDNAELRDERDALAHRMNHVKAELRREAGIDKSGLLSSHLARLFGEPK